MCGGTWRQNGKYSDHGGERTTRLALLEDGKEAIDRKQKALCVGPWMTGATGTCPDYLRGRF